MPAQVLPTWSSSAQRLDDMADRAKRLGYTGVYHHLKEVANSHKAYASSSVNSGNLTDGRRRSD